MDSPALTPQQDKTEPAEKEITAIQYLSFQWSESIAMHRIPI